MRDDVIVAGMGILAIGILDAAALSMGIDGTAMAASVGAIGAIVGAIVGHRVGRGGALAPPVRLSLRRAARAAKRD